MARHSCRTSIYADSISLRVNSRGSSMRCEQILRSLCKGAIFRSFRESINPMISGVVFIDLAPIVGDRSNRRIVRDPAGIALHCATRESLLSRHRQKA